MIICLLLQKKCFWIVCDGKKVCDNVKSLRMLRQSSISSSSWKILQTFECFDKFVNLTFNWDLVEIDERINTTYSHYIFTYLEGGFVTMIIFKVLGWFLT